MLVRYSRRVWIIILVAFAISLIAISLDLYSPGWAVFSADRAHVSMRQRNYRVAIPYPNVSGGRDDGFINAYDTVVSRQAGQLVAVQLRRHFWATPLAVTLFSICSGDRDNSRRLSTLVVQVVFHDHSERTYTYNCSMHRYAPIADTAKDSGMNIIPENPRMAANGGVNTYGFSGARAAYDRRNLVRQLARFYAAGNYSDAATDLTCAWNPWDKTPLRCHTGI